HRLLWRDLERRTPLPAGHVALLHVSPEECLRERILELPSVRYVSLDMAGDRAMVRGNVASLPFGEAEFDVVLCNHVLEHVADDRGALAELHRVLRLGGTAYIQAPVNPRLTTTLEDRTV